LLFYGLIECAKHHIGENLLYDSDSFYVGLESLAKLRNY